MLGWRLLATRVRRGGGFMQRYPVYSGNGWMPRGAWYPRRTHSCCLSRGGEFLHARCTLLNRNNTFLMENPANCVRAGRVPGVLQFTPVYLRRINIWIHYALKSGRMIHRDSHWNAVNTLTSTFPTWKGCWPLLTEALKPKTMRGFPVFRVYTRGGAGVYTRSLAKG